jgi:hypothetical protein
MRRSWVRRGAATPLSIIVDAVIGMSREKPLVHARTARSIALPLVLMAASMTAAISVAIATTYHPLILGWLMMAASVICSLLNYAGKVHIGKLEHALRASDLSADQVLVIQGKSFRAWFMRHSIPWMTASLAAALLCWHTWGAWPVGVALMAASLACGLFGVMGLMTPARIRALGLCWRVPCPIPTFGNVSTALMDAGVVMALRGRSDYSHAYDWASTGGRFLDDLLVAEEMSKVGRPAPLVFFRERDADMAALAVRERVGRALVLAPLFVLTLVIAWLPVSLLSGAPLPRLIDVIWPVGSNGSVATSHVPANESGTSPSSSPLSDNNAAEAGDDRASSSESRNADGSGQIASAESSTGDAEQLGKAPSGSSQTDGGQAPSQSNGVRGSPDGASAGARGEQQQGAGSGRSTQSAPSDAQSQERTSGSAASNSGGASDSSASSSPRAGSGATGRGGAGTGSAAQATASASRANAGTRGGQGQGVGPGRGTQGAPADAESQGRMSGLEASNSGSGSRSSSSGSAGAGTGESQGRDSGSGPGGSGRASGFSSGGPPPQRASTPATIPPLPINPGAVIEVPLPSLTRVPEGSDGSASSQPGPQPTPAGRAPRYEPLPPSDREDNGSAPAEPVQRWPNWVFRLLHTVGR